MTIEAESTTDSFPFQAEVAELLRLMVHSVYSETDVFLRELISNGSRLKRRFARHRRAARPPPRKLAG